MPFVTISVRTPLGEYQFAPGRQHSLLRVLQALLELELKRDFEVGSVALVERDDGTSELIANCTGPRAGKPLTPQEQQLFDQINTMLAPDYTLGRNGDVMDAQGTPIPGLGVDWRGVAKLIALRGDTVLPGFIESIVAGAKEIQQQVPRVSDDG